MLWAEVTTETGRGKNQFRIRELFADERGCYTILEFFSMERAKERRRWDE